MADAAQGRVADGLEVIHHMASATRGSSLSDEACTTDASSSAAQGRTGSAQASAADGEASGRQDVNHSKSEGVAETGADSSTASLASSLHHNNSATASSTTRDDESAANVTSQPGSHGQEVSAAQAGEIDKLHLIVVDASSGDASLAMTCPPAAFMEQGFLKDAAACLRPEGVLAINFVTRSKDALTAAYQTLLVHLPPTPAH